MNNCGDSVLALPLFCHTDLSFVLLELSRTVYACLDIYTFRLLLFNNFFASGTEPMRTAWSFLWMPNCLVYLYLNFLIKTVFHHKRKQFDNHMYRSIPRTYSISFRSIWDLHNGQQFVELAVLVLYIHTHHTLHKHTCTYSDFEITTMLIMPRQKIQDIETKMLIAIVSCSAREKSNHLTFNFYSLHVL